MLIILFNFPWKFSFETLFILKSLKSCWHVKQYKVLATALYQRKIEDTLFSSNILIELKELYICCLKEENMILKICKASSFLVTLIHLYRKISFINEMDENNHLFPPRNSLLSPATSTENWLEAVIMLYKNNHFRRKLPFGQVYLKTGTFPFFLHLFYVCKLKWNSAISKFDHKK